MILCREFWGQIICVISFKSPEMESNCAHKLHLMDYSLAPYLDALGDVILDFELLLR